MDLGLNADPMHRQRYTISALSGSGAGYVRFPLRLGRAYQGYARSILANGMVPLLVVTGEWWTPREKARQDWAAGFRRIYRDYPFATVLQVANEVDWPAGEGQGSGPLPVEVYNAQLRAARDVYPDGVLIGAGAANSEPYYFDDAENDLLDCFGAHMATRTPENVGERIAMYADRFGLPVVVSEWYAQHEAYADEHERAVAVSRFLVAMCEAGAEMACFYALDDRQYDGGLVGVHGRLWESYAAFAGAA